MTIYAIGTQRLLLGKDVGQVQAVRVATEARSNIPEGLFRLLVPVWFCMLFDGTGTIDDRRDAARGDATMQYKT